MSRVRRSLASAALLLAAACSQDGPTPSPLIGKTKGLADQACACTTAACVEPLVSAKSALTIELSGATLTADDVEALAREAQRFADCVGKLAPPRPRDPHH